MNHLSLFSGIGGLDLAAEWAGFRTVAFVEREPYCRAVLAKRWPGVPIIDDVRLVPNALGERFRDGGRAAASGSTGEVCGEVREQRVWPDAESAGEARARIAVISGGFPCQPHSVAGKRKASGDERDLWPEFARIIGAIQPRWVVAENVPGLLTSEKGEFFGRILEDLARMGYRTGWGRWRASDVGALHRRERVFIVAHAAAGTRQREAPGEAGHAPLGREDVADAERERGCGRHAEREDATDAWESSRRSLDRIWLAEPAVGRVAHGIPSRVHRLRALGNAVVPQQAFVLFQAIAEAEGMTTHTTCNDKE